MNSLKIEPNIVDECFGADTNIVLSMYPAPQTNPYSFIWSDGHSGTTNGDTIRYRIINSGSYSITVTDKFGCEANAGFTNAFFENVNAILKGDTVFAKMKNQSLHF